MAERVGFEPTVRANVRRFSRPFRYNHFGISPYLPNDITILFYYCQGFFGKKLKFLGRETANVKITSANLFISFHLLSPGFIC